MAGFSSLSAVGASHSCSELTFAEVAVASGTLPLYLDLEASHACFAQSPLPLLQLAQVLASTRLVGMHCPGRYSVFSGLDFVFHSTIEPKPIIAYRVTRSDARFSMARMELRADGLEG